MKNIRTLFTILCIAGFLIASGFYVFPDKRVLNKDFSVFPSPYSGLVFEKTEEIKAQSGVKSVLFNSDGTKLYALNLEGMSIFEFDRVSKILLRVIKFKPSEALGWDYAQNKSIPSFAEKPVEACLSEGGKILWVSLHNAGGIVALRLDSLPIVKNKILLPNHKEIYITRLNSLITDTLMIPLIKTGKTPKVIARTLDGRNLLVSNWHSQTISVLAANDTLAPYARKIASISVKGIPRGIAVDNRNKKSYVTIMNGRTISVINHKTWKVESNLPTAYNPRHIVADSAGRLFISFNALAQLACISGKSGKVLFKTATHERPRTIVLSKNQKFIFVTCYGGNTLDVFRINKNSFTRVATLKSDGMPVGADIYEDERKLEVWVCNWMSGSLKIFTFKKLG